MSDLETATRNRAPRRAVEFLRSTVVGGVLFLVPLIVILVVLQKAHTLFLKLAVGIGENLPPDVVAAIPTPRVVAIIAIVAFCFLAGLFAKTKLAQRLGAWLESALLSNIPGYSFMKGVGEDLMGVEGKSRDVLLVRIEDAWQVGFLIETLQAGHVAVYVPGAPNPLSGSIYFLTEDRIKPLGVPTASAMKCIRALGFGANKLTEGKL